VRSKAVTVQPTGKMGFAPAVPARLSEQLVAVARDGRAGEARLGACRSGRAAVGTVAS
jgi:hypothetical protein